MIAKEAIMKGKAADEQYPCNLLMEVRDGAPRLADLAEFDPMDLSEEQMDGLEYAISTMLPNDQIGIDLLFRQGMTIPQAAKHLGLSTSGVSQRRSHIISALRRYERLGFIIYGRDTWNKKLQADARMRDVEERSKEQLFIEKLRLLTAEALPLSTIFWEDTCKELARFDLHCIGDIANLTPEEFIKKTAIRKKEADEIIRKVRSVVQQYAEHRINWIGGKCSICGFRLPVGAIEEDYRFCPHCGSRTANAEAVYRILIDA